MGQTCSRVASCGHYDEADQLELSRSDSPDPVMYDLMRKSIQATTPVTQFSTKPSKRKVVGQHHLLYKNAPKYSSTPEDAVPSSSPPSSGGGGGGTVVVGSGSHNNNNIPNDNDSSSSSSPTTTTATATNNNNNHSAWLPPETPVTCPTRLLIRRRSLKVLEEGGSGTHIYAIRYPEESPDKVLLEQAATGQPSQRQEQCPNPRPPPSSTAHTNNSTATSATTTITATNSSTAVSSTAAAAAARRRDLPIMPSLEGQDVFTAAAMASTPRQPVLDWVTVSEEHNIYIADVGLTANQCDHLVQTTEIACRGQYAAYTYAKQTLGCREYPVLARTSFSPVHTVVHAITQRFSEGLPTTATSTKEQQQQQDRKTVPSTITSTTSTTTTKDNNNNNKQQTRKKLQLDDREPHIVKYDVTKKERQKLDMHTDKSEWTFLIALSNGCGVDYEGGGTYFECLDATVHIQRGHALIFPGRLRHCGQKITSGLRFLLVGFLVDKSSSPSTNSTASATPAASSATATSGTAAAGTATATTHPTAIATITATTSPSSTVPSPTPSSSGAPISRE